MSLQSSAQVPLGLPGEPPVSLLSEDGPELREAPAPPDPTLRPPLEAQLVQEGKLSMGQLAQAHRDRLEKGGAVLDIVVERGWVSAEEVAALRAAHGVEAPAPAQVVEVVPAQVDAAPEPEALQQTVTSIEPAATPEESEIVAHVQPEALQQTVTKSDLEPAPGTPPLFKVCIRLASGELIAAGQSEDAAQADAIAQAVVADLATPEAGSWPSFDGRYIRPETIVSVDVVANP
jgi:hypothetical protein